MTINDDRFKWAGAALGTFMLATGTDIEDALADLLADLMHWANQNHVDFDLELQRGRDHYEVEIVEDAEEVTP